ncbi:PREDICTED: uncharacterized protein LOC103330974 isoform X1 [Prunus mume]|uniref:Uncharacterized protein LOC103330974 isoform X1 n=1 Tax=Prunus mume TaxID=102107 RepID=A0ABM0NYP8_PRUMU|nr:PREDICTED: uncharacterized protein LOC103330974 isoform X1 [Prunus mume]
MVVKRSQAHLSKDSKVEVCSNEDGYKGAWFPAIILDPQPSDRSPKKKRRSLGNSSKALVQYESLVSDDDPNKPLTELVDVRSIRPVPPPDNPDQPLEPADVVDASYSDAWWVGVVMRFEDDKYTVGFKNPPDLLELRRSELRPHWDLQDGIWVVAQKERMAGSIFSPGTAVEVNLSKERLFCAWFPAIYLGELGVNSFLLQYKSSNNYDFKVVVGDKQIRPQPPKLAERDFRLLEKVDAFCDMGWCVGVIKKVIIGKKYMVGFKFTEEVKQYSQSELRPRMCWTDGRWVTMINGERVTMINGNWVPYFKKTNQKQVGALDNRTIVSNKRKVKKGSEIENADEEDVEDEYGLDNIESSGISSDSELTGGSTAGTSCLLPIEEVVQNEDGVSSEIKGNGKLREYLVEHSKDPATGEKHNGTGVVAQVELTKTQAVNDNGSEDAMVEAETEATAIDIEKIIEGLSNPAGFSSKQNEVRGRQVETGITGSEEGMKESKTVDSAMDYSTKEVQVSVTGISATACAHDQPLSLCIDEMHSVKAIECSSNPARTANQQNEVRGTQVEQQDSPHLPFVRSSPFWESIESMEIFKRFPQKPHFHPLVKCKAVCREGSALGNMITFASLVEKTSKLQVGDPRDIFDSNLEALVDLEMLGFDVKAVRHRLKELLEMKVELGQLQNQSKEVEIQIMECTLDRTRNNETISRIDKMIKHLKEKQAMLMSIDVAKGFEISKLQSEANAITEGIQNIHRDFEKLTTAAW